MKILVYSCHEKYGVYVLAHFTEIPFSIVSPMLAEGEVPELGVLPPEVTVKPKPFFAELAKRGIKINETVETICIL